MITCLLRQKHAKKTRRRKFFQHNTLKLYAKFELPRTTWPKINARRNESCGDKNLLKFHFYAFLPQNP